MTGRLEITFRRATLEDVENLDVLIQSAYRGDSSRAGWTTEADLLDGQRTDPQGIVDVIGAHESLMLIAESAGQLVGCCQLENRQGASAYVGMFAVSPNSQGHGVGNAVMSEAERIAMDEFGAREMRMSVIRQREELIAWYERLGYSPTGEMQPFPYGDERFGVPRRDDLEFSVMTKPLGRL